MVLSDRITRPELLAPAGDRECIRAAIENGADAVYFGLDTGFNARARAKNFDPAELSEIMAELHRRGLKGYVTLNTLIFPSELPQVETLVRQIAAAGVDAVLVQDLGLVRLIREICPDLPIHASTQMTLTSSQSIAAALELGAERVVLARECSIKEITRIARETTMPLEVFVHGALCVAYSGQCLTSESLGGRSANRGQCAQACRLPYDLLVDGVQRDLGDQAYLLSPQDLAAPELIPALTDIGVACFKIEGRLKSAQYVAATTQTYRAALDAGLQHQEFRLSPQQEVDLNQSFSRGFTHGFLDGVNHQTLVPGRFPKSRGVRIGTVCGKTPGSILIRLDGLWTRAARSANGESADELSRPLKPGDGVVFDDGHPEQDEQGGRVFSARSPAGQPDTIEIGFGPGAVNLAAVSVGNLVWRTDDPALRKRLEASYSRDAVTHRIPLTARVRAVAGQPLWISLTAEGITAEVTGAQLLETALKRPLTEEVVCEQMGRLGETPFELTQIELHGVEGPVPAGTDVPVMVPKSLLNDLRRQAVQKLLALRAAAAQAMTVNTHALAEMRDELHAWRVADATASDPNSPPEQSKLYVLVRSLEQLQAVLEWEPREGCGRPAAVYCDFEEVRRYEEAVHCCRAAGMPVALATLRIIKPAEEGWLKQIREYAPDFVLVRNLAALTYFAERAPQIGLLGDYSLNVANELTARIFAEQGLVRLVPSYDLNWQQLTALAKNFPTQRLETVIHQHMPMFHMEHCVFAATLSNGKDYRDCGRPCDRHRVELRDRVGSAHPLMADVGCRNTVFNASAQSAAEYVPRMQELGLRQFRVELLREPAAEIRPLLDRYAGVLARQEDGRNTWRQLQVLNQLGVTRGTLDFE